MNPHCGNYLLQEGIGNKLKGTRGNAWSVRCEQELEWCTKFGYEISETCDKGSTKEQIQR